MRKFSFKFMPIFMLGLVLLHASPLFSQDTTIEITERALRNALIETCYGNRVLVDLNDPDKTYVSLEEAGLADEDVNTLVAAAAETDGSYEALSDLLIAYCLGEDVVVAIWSAGGDRAALEPILIDAGIPDVEIFFYVIEEYVYFEQQTYIWFESYSFTEEQYAAIFFTMEFSTSFELTELLVEYGVDEADATEFADYAEETTDEIESESSVDEDGDGVLDIEDEDDDEDGIVDDEDDDADGDGIDDEEEDDDLDGDGIDDEEDDDTDGDGVDDAEDEDDDGDGVDDDDADGDGVDDDEDEDDDGDGVDDSEDSDDDGDGEDEDDGDSMVDDGGDDDGGDE
jgi:hypothetical protein